ncbi:MAG: hypothetical protein MUF24_07450 [Chitinophagaceae bacterium]|jgi:hypothetical protein|nr:hypothetical protein [Chitinophagaceae bacterium]
MEKVQSLFNKLETAIKSNGSVDTLMMLLGQIREELQLIAGEDTGVTYQNGVAVLLPAGYKSVENNEQSRSNNEGKELTEVEALTPEPAEILTLEHALAAVSQPEPEATVEDEIAAFLAVPKPPRQINIQFPLYAEPEKAAPVEEEPEMPALINMHFEAQKPEVFTPAFFAPLTKREEVLIESSIDVDGPIVFELEVPEELKAPAEAVVPEYNAARTRVAEEPAAETLTQHKPKELHEILAERVVAKPAGSSAGASSRGGLSDLLGATKIADLRKAISINDKFRFINGLFNGDEVFFERAVKTINSFSVLHEAQYWIQRELTIKNGWNDEDELVQQFYQLVNRRFL